MTALSDSARTLLVRVLVGALLILPFPGLVVWGWHSAATTEVAIGGLLPVDDALSYLGEVIRFLDGSPFGQSGSRRPLAVLSIAFRTWLVDGDYRASLLLQAGLVGAASVLAAAALKRSHGLAAAVLLYLFCLGYATIFTTTELTESTGFTLGALAFALYWSGYPARNGLLCAVGTLALGFALLIRPGPIPALGLVIVLITWQLAQTTRGRLVVLAQQMAALALVYVVNHHVVGVMSDPQGAANANLAETVYGLSVGRDWHAALADFPALYRSGERAAAAFLYSRAADNLLTSPLPLIQALLGGVNKFLAQGWVLGPVRLPGLVLVAGLIAMLIALPKMRSRGGLPVLVTLSIGILLSVPLIFTDGRGRVFATLAPASLALMAIVLGALPGYLSGRRGWQGFVAAATPRGGNDETPILALGLTLLLVGGLAGGAFLALPPKPKAAAIAATETCPERQSRLTGRFDDRVPRLLIAEGAWPAIPKDRFLNGLRYAREEFTGPVTAISVPSFIGYFWDETGRGRMVRVIVDAALVPAKDRPVILCTERRQSGLYDFEIVKSVTVLTAP